MDDHQKNEAVQAIHRLLSALGDDVVRDPQLHETPERFAELLFDRFIPRQTSPLRALPAEDGACGPIVVRGIPFHALCAHHIVPFFGVVHIAYMPHEHLAGFGAFPRLVDELSRGPQLQERLASYIADAISEDLDAAGVIVRIDARQMCMELTGNCGTSNTVVIAARGIYDTASAHNTANSLFGPTNA